MQNNNPVDNTNKSIDANKLLEEERVKRQELEKQLKELQEKQQQQAQQPNSESEKQNTTSPDMLEKMAVLEKEQRALSELNNLVGKSLSAEEWKTYVQKKHESKKRKAMELTNAIIKDIEQSYQTLGLQPDETAKSVISQMQNEPLSMAPMSKLLSVSSAATRHSLSKKEEEFQKEQQKRKETEQKLAELQNQLNEKDALLKRTQTRDNYYNQTSNPYKVPAPVTNTANTPNKIATTPSTPENKEFHEREINNGNYYVSTPSRRDVVIRSPFTDDDELDAKRFREMMQQTAKKTKL